MLAAGSNYTAGLTGGEATHILTVDEMPSHSHKQRSNTGAPNLAQEGNGVGAEFLGNSSTPIGNTFSTGGGLAHNNMPPYLVVYMWKRIE